MTKLNVEPTAEVIDQAAQYLREKADELERKAKDLRETGHFMHASFAAKSIANIMQNIKFDLLVSRPVFAYERANAERAFAEEQAAQNKS